MSNRFVPYLFAATCFVAQNTWSAAVTIPAGTKLMGELDQRVTSNTRKFEVGDVVKGHVWRNVVVDGYVVIEAGAPMLLRVADMKKRRIAGRGGDIELDAISVTAADGTEIYLDGGYDKQATHRTALAASLSALVFWPAIFIRGKEAVLEPGTIFDASVPADTRLEARHAKHALKLRREPDINVEILYADMADDARELPMLVTLCTRAAPADVRIDTVNGVDVSKIAFDVESVQQEGECQAATGAVGLKALSEHFRPGINRFTLTDGRETAEVILDVEM